MNKMVKVFLECALGAFLGAIFALQLNQYFWWVGMLVGAGLGCLSFEFKTVVAAIPQAWSATVKTLDEYQLRIFMALELWLYMAVSAGGVVLAGYSLSWLNGFRSLEGIALIGNPNFLRTMSWVIATDLSLVMIASVVVVVVAFCLSILALDEGLEDDHGSTLKESRQLYLAVNPLSLLFTIPAALVYGLYRLVKQLPKVSGAIMAVLKFLGTLLWHLFKLIHSETRLLCGVDAAIGAAIGYYFGSPIIGALAGGLLGVINYEMVSKRWLKLAPASNNT